MSWLSHWFWGPEDSREQTAAVYHRGISRRNTNLSGGRRITGWKKVEGETWPLAGRSAGGSGRANGISASSLSTVSASNERAHPTKVFFLF